MVQRPKSSRREQVITLRKSGLTYAEIGRQLGITREGARQLAKVKSASPDLSSKVILRVSEVAQLVGVHTNTVRRWSQEGTLKAYRIGNRGDRRFRRDDVDSFLREAETWQPT